MEYRASHRYAHMSPHKARASANLIRGLGVNQALLLLNGHRTRGAAIFIKVLKSAISNAGQNDAVNVDDLIVSDARVDGGPLVHGRPTFRPGPMGRAMTIRRRTSHFRIGVSEKTAAEVK
jgi:large subunit ribosomal protein L22